MLQKGKTADLDIDGCFQVDFLRELWVWLTRKITNIRKFWVYKSATGSCQRGNEFCEHASTSKTMLIATLIVVNQPEFMAKVVFGYCERSVLIAIFGIIQPNGISMSDAKMVIV